MVGQQRLLLARVSTHNTGIPRHRGLQVKVGSIKKLALLIHSIEAMEVGWGLRERTPLILVGVLEPLEAIVKVLQTLQLGYSPSTLYFPSGATCYDNTAANCRGTEILTFNTARDCCLGNGSWVIQPNGECVQCIGK